MNQSFASWMLTGATRGEFRDEARRMEHLRAIHEVRSERQAARRAARNVAIAEAVAGLRVRLAGGSAQTSPDCCPA